MPFLTFQLFKGEKLKCTDCNTWIRGKGEIQAEGDRVYCHFPNKSSTIVLCEKCHEKEIEEED